MERLQRSFGLDLLRALAVSLVLVSHFSDGFASLWHLRPPAWVSMSGFFGVELFFVLSGFLIGGLLLRIIRRRPTGRDWLVFMTRRWMRTLPVYLVWLAVLAVLWPPPDHLWWHIGHYATLTQNLFWPMPADNWFGVSWSLTIEEWFYLLFSAALLCFVALTGGRFSIWWVIALFMAVPLAARLSLPAAEGIAGYKVAALRLDAIAYGVVLARLADLRSGLFRNPYPALAAGVPLVLFAWVQVSTGLLPIPAPLFRAVLVLLISGGFALCVPAALRLPAPARPLAWLVRQLSAQSYAIYIIHLSILEMALYGAATHRIGPYTAIIATLGASFGLSYASWRWFETPILAHRPRQSRPEPPAAFAPAALEATP